jgi:Rieske Fe-S protein
MQTTVESSPSGTPRRGFLTALGAIVAGSLALFAPLVSAVMVILHPVVRRSRNTSAETTYYRVAHVSAVPSNGHPRQFAVTADQRDAWTSAPNQRIGAVYLRRQATQSPSGEAGDQTDVETDVETDGKAKSLADPNGVQIEAFNVICPHAGCFVGFRAADEHFHCPCHNSSFGIDGGVIPPSPSARGLDRLAVKVDADGAVWVAFQNFYAGRPDKVART